MGSYQPLGSRDGEFKEFQKISFLKNNIKDIDEEKVQDFSLVMCKLLNWIQLALEIRCEDVVNRRDTVEYVKHDREQAKIAQDERQHKYEQELADAKSTFDEKLASDHEPEKNDDEPKEQPKFDEDEFKTQFNE